MVGFFAPSSHQLSQSIRKMITFSWWTPNLRSCLSVNDPIGLSFRRAGAAQRGGGIRYTQKGRSEEDPGKGAVERDPPLPGSAVHSLRMPRRQIEPAEHIWRWF